MRRWLRDFGFPVLVLAALAVSGYLAASALVPDPVPDFDGRGFAELGAKGLRATDVVRATDEQEVSLSENEQINRDLAEGLEKTNVALHSAVKALREQEARLEILEDER